MKSVTAATSTSSNDSCIAINEERASTVDNYLDSLSVGYRFIPTDQELMTHYLLKKIKNEALETRFLKQTFMTLIQKILQQITLKPTKAYGTFSHRERGSIYNVDAGPGYWKASGQEKVIKDNGDKILGVKKGFSYLEGRLQNSTKTVWLMQEYVVKGYERQRSDANDNKKLDDYVLCKIYKTGRMKVTDDEHPPADQNRNVLQADQNNQSMNPTSYN